MKKLLRLLLGAGLTAALLTVPAFALRSPLPESPQGDFYVVVNGAPITFANAAPQIRNNRSCLPFVDVFHQLGFDAGDMSWDAQARTVTAVNGDTTVSLTIDEPQITLTRAGETTVHPTDIAPYISDNRTYIPFGVLADLLGYNVGWDSSLRAVIIDDVDALLAENTETFALMDQYLEYSRSLTRGTQKVSGSYTMDMAVVGVQDGQTLDLHFLTDGDYGMLIADNTAFQFDTQLVMDFTAAMNGVDATELIDSTGELPFPMTVEFDMRGDLKEGVLYFSLLSDTLGQLSAIPSDGGDDIWFKLDLKALYDQIGMDYAQLMELAYAYSDKPFEDALAAVLKAMPSDSVNTTAWDLLSMYNALLGDSHFQKSGSSYVNTLELDGVKMILTLTTSGSKVNGYYIEMSTADPALAGMEMAITAEMKGSKMEMSIGMAIPMDDAQGEGDSGQTGLSLSMSMDGAYRPTSSKPETEPPAGATVLDLAESMGGGQPTS